LGDALLDKIRKGDFVDSSLWCLSRLGARKLFYGPNNLVVPPPTAVRWVESLLKVESARDAVAAIARHTRDASRDLPTVPLELVRRAFPEIDPEAEDQPDLAALG